MVIDCEVIIFHEIETAHKIGEKNLLKNTNNTDRLQKQFTLPEYKVLNTFFPKVSIFVNQI